MPHAELWGLAWAPRPLRAAAKRAVIRDRHSPSLIPASRRLMRGGLRPPSERVDVDHGQLVWRGLEDISTVMRLDEIEPVDRRPAGGRERGRFERLADRLENLPDGRRVGDEGDEADVAAAGRALEWKLLADAGEELGPCDSGRGRRGARRSAPCGGHCMRGRRLVPCRRSRSRTRGRRPCSGRGRRHVTHMLDRLAPLRRAQKLSCARLRQPEAAPQ